MNENRNFKASFDKKMENNSKNNYFLLEIKK